MESKTWMMTWCRPILLTVVVFACVDQAWAQPGGRGFGGPGPERGGEESSTPLEPDQVPFELGVAEIPDREMFEKLSYQGPVRMDAYLDGLEFVKFIVIKAATDEAKIYWMNTENIQMHPRFMGSIGLGGGRGGRGRGRFGAEEATGGRTMRGAITYLPRLKSPNGTPGLYIFDFQPNDQFAVKELKSAQDMILKTMPFVDGKLAYHAFRESEYTSQQEAFADAKIAVHLDRDIYGEIAYLPLNIAESYGLLRWMENETRPSPRDIVICKTLPNQMPRVAGVISAVRQTPLSHVNLRAVQDKVPNAYVENALQSPDIQSLVGKFVHYRVTEQGYELREVTKAEVDQHFDALRPAEPMSPKRDLSQHEAQRLRQIQFQDAARFGVKASNLAAMHSFGLTDGTIPEGWALPFYFYDEFMKHNDFYRLIDDVLARSDFQADRAVQEQELQRIRERIRGGDMPDWMLDALTQVQASFPEGTSIRCRSSTNNEDLPGFSGAGLYDSYTHHPHEGHLSKTIKQVFASLWNFRAFEERAFYRIDHQQTAMGVVLHPNFRDERVNGVGVTDDILYGTQGNYYLNVQAGEDLVTNPNSSSVTEEVLLGWWERDGHQIVRPAKPGEPLLTNEQLGELRTCLTRIHARFRELYGKSREERFAMEIEFKVTSDGKLAIKQARPWVF